MHGEGRLPPFNESTQLIDIFGPPQGYNNLNEPKPFTNEPATLIGFVVSFLAVSWLFVCFRLYVRIRVLRTPGWDDFFVVLYLLSTTAVSVVFLLCIKYGAGRHFLLLTLYEVTRYFQLFYALNINLNISAATIKLSLLFQFLRIFDRKGWPWKASVVGIVLVTLWGTAFLMLSIVPCANVPDAWNVLAARTARCWGYASQDPDSFVATLIGHNAINTFFDLYIIAIPLHIYTKPNVALRTRLGLMVLLLMGATVVTLSVWRMYETAWYRGGWHPTRDPTWYGPRAIMLMVLEVNVASICASVPIFWPIVGQYLMNAIFVTHEFSVKYESRENQAKADADSLDGGESGRQSGAGGSVGGGPAVSEQHYKDDFVMQLVDPFGAGNRGTQSRVGTSAGLSVK